jgi:lipid-A-disaccharide synthase
VRELKGLVPGVEVFGMGGPELLGAGCRLVVDNSKLHVMGFVEVLGKIGEVRAAWHAMYRAAEEERPDAAVLVDYPGFNMRLARRLRALGVRVLYYVSPQVWAWNPGRTRKMGRICEKVLTLFPFEKDLYERAGVSAECVGHPLGDELPGDYPAKADALLKELGLTESDQLLALLPGSRPMELARHLEVFCRAARLVREARPAVKPVLAVTAEAPGEEIVRRAREAADFEVPVLAGRTREVLAAADLAIVVSGTATLEAALLGCPMVVCYRTGWVNYLLGRLLVTIPCIALANIVAGRPLVPELWQGEVNPRQVADSALALLEDADARKRMSQALLGLRENLGPRQSSRRAAEAVAAVLSKGQA